jgi:alpha-amylase
MGTRGAILAAMGNTSYQIPATYVVVASGTNYRLALSKSIETAWVSKPSGEYEGAFNLTMTAVSQTEGAQLVYTLDGSEPTATRGTKVADGASVNISNSCTLKVGLLINGTVSGVITRKYTIDNSTFEPYEIMVFLKDPTVAPNNWSVVNYYTWDSSNKQFNGNWPGESITNTKMVHGVKFYYTTYQITGKNYYMNFVFNQGPSNVQTEDVTYVNKTSFFEVTTQTNKYQVKDVTDIYLPYLNEDLTGDVNNDGEVNIADINTLVDMILSGDTSSAGDVDEDNEVGISDVNALINIILAS